jgi:hypothetical protein
VTTELKISERFRPLTALPQLTTAGGPTLPSSPPPRSVAMPNVSPGQIFGSPYLSETCSGEGVSQPRRIENGRKYVA